MLINLQHDMKGRLELERRAADIDDHPVRMGGGDVQTVRVGEIDQREEIRFGGAKPFGELRGGKELVEVGAAGVIKLLQKTGEVGLVAQGQRNGKAQFIGRCQAPDWPQIEIGHRHGHLTRHQLPRRGLRRG